MKRLYLLPNVLHEDSDWSCTLPQCDGLIAESERGGNRYLKRFGLSKIPVYLLNEHTPSPHHLLTVPHDAVGLITDAGLPCLADPGAELVKVARARGILIEAIPGPCSLILALQLSGLSGQRFTFHGYFPRGAKEFGAKMRGLPREISHLFIETPYRADPAFQMLLTSLPPGDIVSIGVELMGPQQLVQTHTICDWRRQRLSLTKKRVVFTILRKGSKGESLLY